MSTNALANILNLPADYHKAPTLGHLVWMRCIDVKRTWENTEDEIVDHALPVENFRRTKPKKAFSLACQKMRRSGRNQDNRIVVRPVKETLDYARYQISLERVVGGTELKYEKELVAVFDKAAEEVTFEGGVGLLGGQVEDEIIKHYEHFRDHACAENLSKYAHELITEKWMGISVRSQGGVWFVPEDYTNELKKLEALFNSFGSTLYLHPVLNTDQWRQNVRQMADDSLDYDLNTLLDELDGKLDDAEQEEMIKRKTLETRLARFADVQKRATAYETLLNLKAEEVGGKIKQATQKIKSILTGHSNIAILEPKTKPKK